MKYKHSIKAFTFPEVLVTMVVSIILIGLIYESMQLFAIKYNAYRSFNQKLNSTIILQHIFTKDVNLASKIIKKNNGVLLISCYGSNIKYDIIDSIIIRNAVGSIDTFLVYPEKLSFLFSGKNMLVDGIIDEIKFSTGPRDMKNQIVIYKEYAADILIEQETLQNGGWNE